MKKTRISLRMGLLGTILVCWMVPIIIIVAMASVMLNNSYQQSVRQELEDGVTSAMDQVCLQLERAISDSHAVSYDGIVRRAYRSYQQDHDGIALFRSTNDYLNQSFFQDAIYKAMFINFWDPSIGQPYVLGDDTSYGIRLNFRRNEDQIMKVMENVDADIRFLYVDGNLYMARNLLDSSFNPYATVITMFQATEVFKPLKVIDDVRIRLDNCQLHLDEQGDLMDPVQIGNPENELNFTVEADNFTLTVSTTLAEYNPWSDSPWLRWAVVLVALMVLPLLIAMVVLFTKHVSSPMETVAQAHQLVRAGARGYTIKSRAPNAEFEKLYANFNVMSTELKDQFDRAYLEQQATQRAQIKALQSQINPHFLNNTLEIINWEARIAENDRVSAMIEALSTMLDAALDRDGRTQIPLEEEIGYVDAYLYIIQERLGEGFYVHKELDDDILLQKVPRLILQPIVENAVEHDITARRGGNLWVRAYLEGDMMFLEVEHDGSMTPEDKEKIKVLLSDEEIEGSRVGLRNVHQRLRLIYGNRGSLRLEETPAKTIRARISFPAGQE